MTQTLPAPEHPVPAPVTLRGSWLARYARWRDDRDFATVVGALSRLSDRQLAMIGLRRDRLCDHVEGMIEGAARDRQMATDVIALVDRPRGRAASAPAASRASA